MRSQGEHHTKFNDLTLNSAEAYIGSQGEHHTKWQWCSNESQQRFVLVFRESILQIQMWCNSGSRESIIQLRLLVTWQGQIEQLIDNWPWTIRAMFWQSVSFCTLDEELISGMPSFPCPARLFLAMASFFEAEIMACHVMATLERSMTSLFMELFLWVPSCHQLWTCYVVARVHDQFA